MVTTIERGERCCSRQKADVGVVTIRLTSTDLNTMIAIVSKTKLPMLPGVNLGDFGVDASLRQRGFVIAARGDYAQTIAPAGMQPGQILSSGACMPDWDNDFYRRMSKISQRKMLRFMLAHPEGVSEVDLSNELQQERTTVHKRVLHLEKAGVIRECYENRWCLSQAIDNFGPTYERYVKSIFEREFSWSAEWGIELEDFAYGDFDVLATTASTLCYVECKTSRPQDVRDEQLRFFLQRSQDLAPEIAVLLLDTEDSLDKPLEQLENILTGIRRKEMAKPSQKPEKPFFIEPARFAGVHFGCRRIFVTNAKPSVVHNLRLCLKFYWTWLKFQSFLSGPQYNYVTEEVFPFPL
ncbi:MAG: hypothetical protein R6U93_00450 [Dehalococcoidia bacterium]